MQMLFERILAHPPKEIFEDVKKKETNIHIEEYQK